MIFKTKQNKAKTLLFWKQIHKDDPFNPQSVPEDFPFSVSLNPSSSSFDIWGTQVFLGRLSVPHLKINPLWMHSWKVPLQSNFMEPTTDAFVAWELWYPRIFLARVLVRTVAGQQSLQILLLASHSHALFLACHLPERFKFFLLKEWLYEGHWEGDGYSIIYWTSHVQLCAHMKHFPTFWLHRSRFSFSAVSTCYLITLDFRIEI